MAKPDDLLAELPAPHPEEPFSLRRDIADELRDHLECAARRESLKCSDPHIVECQVIARFGNPQKIARKLWLDAMKEILKMQKVTLVLVSIVAVASLAACGLMWSLARDFQAVASDAQEASAKLLSQGQETNAALLKQNSAMMEQLAALANRDAQPHSYLDWIPLKVEIVKADGKDTPGTGFTVGVRGKALAESEEIALTETTTEQGIADFGVVRPGYYSLDIDAPWGEKYVRQILVKPGAPHVERIESPVAPPKEMQVRPFVKWPEELKGKNLAVLVEVRRADITKAGESQWYGGGGTLLLIRPDETIPDSERFAVYLDTISETMGSFPSFGGSHPSLRVDMPSTTVKFRGPRQVSLSTFPWRGGEAVVSGLKLVKLPPDAQFPGNGETLPCIVDSWTMNDFLRSMEPGRNNPDAPEVRAQIRVQGEAPQTWIIEIPQETTTIARAIVTKEQFPNLPPGYVAQGAWLFFGMDKDGNQEISQAEFAPKSRSLTEVVKEFPVTLPNFIEAYVTWSQARNKSELLRRI